MGFSVVCHGCVEVLYKDRDMIPINSLLSKYGGRFAAESLAFKMEHKESNQT